MNLEEVFKNSTSQILDDRRPFINEEIFSLLMLINPAIITCGISIIGIGANFVNIFIFIKIGFKETINISLICLAVSDLASLFVLLWMSLSFNPAFCDLVCEVIDLKYYEDSIVGVQRSYFTTIGGCITCLIAFERCLCVLRPLQVKTILTTSRLKIILPSICIVCLVPHGIMFYVTSVMVMAFQGSNQSIVDELTEDYLPYDINQVAYVIVMVLTMSTYITITVLTVLIVWKLTSQSRWRARQIAGDTSRATSDERHDNKKGLTEKDRRATMTVTVIAVMYITCFFPGTIMYLAMTLSIEFNKGMLYSNLYDFLWYVAYIGEGICARANILVYLRTSTKFKEAFWGSFVCCNEKRNECVTSA